MSDQNYLKTDSGEKHVFEITCANGHRRQLHFHKNGKMDPPTLLPNATTSHQFSNTSSGAARPAELHPAWTFEFCMQVSTDTRAPLGRNEVNVALNALWFHFADAGDTWPCCVDVTDTNSFPWPRWLRNVVRNREIVMSGIAKVYMKRKGSDAPITLVFCRADDTYAEVEPRRNMTIIEGSHWRAEPVFTHATIASQSWMRVRRSLNETR